MPDYENNPLIQAIDAKRKAAEEARAAMPKVISISTRQAWTPPAPEKKARKRKPKVDQASLESLERLIEQVRSGEVVGVTTTAWNKTRKGFDLLTFLPPGCIVETEALLYAGVLQLQIQSLLETAEYGPLPEDGPEVVYVDGDDDPELGA